MKADLHIHSIYSPDAISKPETIMEMAAAHNIGFIAITDHERADAWKEMKALEKTYGVKVVFGQEIKLWNGKHSDGEILGLFLKRQIKSNKVPDILAEIRQQGGIASIPHPFCDRRSEFRAFDQIDDWTNLAIEARNGRTLKKRNNEMAEGLAHRIQLPFTAGSDAHTPFEIGSVYLEFDGKSIKDLKHAILNRNVEVHGEASSILFSLMSGFGYFGLAL